MGTCCGAHLQTKIRDYAKNAQNGAVTVTVIENPKIIINTIGPVNSTVFTMPTETSLVITGKCDYCQAPAEFTVSYYPK